MGDPVVCHQGQCLHHGSAHLLFCVTAAAGPPGRCESLITGGGYVKIGLQIPDFTWPGGPARLGADLATVARTADDAGFDSWR